MSRATITIETIVANDLEIRTAGDHRVLDVSLPHQATKRNDEGGYDKVGPTTWFQATFWDEHADAMLRTIEKNTLVHVTGYPEVETYPKRDGTPGAKVLIKFPILSVVVRRPKRADTSPPPADEPWAVTTPGADDIWNPPTPDGYVPVDANDQSPF